MKNIFKTHINDRLAVSLIIITAAAAVFVVWWQLSLIVKPVIYYSDFPYLQIPRIKGGPPTNGNFIE